MILDVFYVYLGFKSIGLKVIRQVLSYEGFKVFYVIW